MDFCDAINISFFFLFAKTKMLLPILSMLNELAQDFFGFFTFGRCLLSVQQALQLVLYYLLHIVLKYVANLNCVLVLISDVAR